MVPARISHSWSQGHDWYTSTPCYAIHSRFFQPWPASTYLFYLLIYSPGGAFQNFISEWSGLWLPCPCRTMGAAIMCSLLLSDIKAHRNSSSELYVWVTDVFFLPLSCTGKPSFSQQSGLISLTSIVAPFLACGFNGIKKKKNKPQDQLVASGFMGPFCATRNGVPHTPLYLVEPQVEWEANMGYWEW